MGLGVVHFMGVLMEPLMRPLFNLPGVGSFVLAMGLASGYPLGAILTARLRADRLCSRTEAERLMSTANTADPLFMTGAVAVGMFNDISVGFVIVAAHYAAAVMVGLVLGLFNRGRDISRPLESSYMGNILVRALHVMADARKKDGRPLGRLMGDSIRDSVNSLLLVGGFIILFSVLIRILSIAGLVDAVSAALTTVVSPFGWNTAVVPSLVKGLFEITMGAQAASQSAVPLVDRVMAAGAVIAWSGLSVHAQVAAVTQGTDIRMGTYVFARFLHAVLAAAATLLIMGPARTAMERLAPVLAPAAPSATPVEIPALYAWAMRLEHFSIRFGLLSLILLLCGLIITLGRGPAPKVIYFGHSRRRR